MGEVIPLLARPSVDEDSTARRRLLGQMIRVARGSRTQAQFAAALGLKQPAISAWEAGRVGLTSEQLYAVESAVGLQHGWLSVASGYVDPDVEPLMLLLEASVGALSAERGRG